MTKVKCIGCGIIFECNGDTRCGLKNVSGNKCYCEKCSEEMGFTKRNTDCFTNIKERVEFT